MGSYRPEDLLILYTLYIEYATKSSCYNYTQLLFYVKLEPKLYSYNLSQIFEYRSKLNHIRICVLLLPIHNCSLQRI